MHLTDIGIGEWLSAVIVPPAIDWIQEHVDLSRDAGSAADGLIVLDPFQIDPILAQYDPACRECVILAVEQTGKSTCWRLPMLHKLKYFPGPRWVIYESDDKAEDINRETFEPYLYAIDEIRHEVERGHAIRRRYMLANGSILDFSGAGADITSKAKRDGVADELDTWPMPAASVRQNLRNFRKRFRTYWRRGVGCLVIVGSPVGQDSPIADEWDGSSQGAWHLRCMHCDRLTIPSFRTDLMQWETDDGGRVVADSIRVECPACGRTHREVRAVEMNDRGAYLHRDDGNRTRRGFQWGAMAAPRVFGWLWIAEQQMAAGSTADPKAHANYDNSVRGVRHKPRRMTGPAKQIIKKHCAPLPDADALAGVFFAADTQDDGWYWIVRGVSPERNTYLLGNGFAHTEGELVAAWDAEYLGSQCPLGIVDEGGHGRRPKDVQELVAAHRGLYSYKGNSRIGVRWKLSKESKALVLANPKLYQADLLTYIYTQTDRSEYYWFLPPEPGAAYLSQLAAVQKDNAARHGDRYENWVPSGADHYFDAEKMWLVLYDFAVAHFRHWRVPVPWGKQVVRETRKPEVTMP